VASYARHTQIPLPILVGRGLSTAEWHAAGHVAGEWTFLEAVSAVALERIDLVRHGLQSIFSEKGARVAPPLQVPRPGESAEPEKMKAGDFAQMLGVSDG
jgi:hypothetical protein